jgi:hypothetical protein
MARIKLNALVALARAFIITGAVILGILLALVLFGQSGLLDAKTIVSVVVPEVGIAVFLYYILGEHRRSRVEEVINLLEACKKFEHLGVYRFTVFPIFSVIYFFVVNKTTKTVYIAPSYIEDMTERGVISKIKVKNYDEMKADIQKKGFVLQEREASIAELEPIENKSVEH